ncbi:OmpA family protein [Luteipulveratus sp. YIM 133132]|uniref:OmpA family protein n=1 Tax=Luteipulveratus flavus TaxID=3031728 RepID=UPI0023AF40FD|nr:OmpA family protein [Luteipulveratus sp. YIM 133132]MDE9366959.1 OmpA family protein [Luteipulveratus sp. YIM 133132]
MNIRTRVSALAAVITAATLLSGCQEEQVVTGTPSANASSGQRSDRSTSSGATSGDATPGADGTDAGRREHLTDKGGYVVQGSKVTFVYNNGVRYVLDVGAPVGDRTTIRNGTGTLTLKDTTATWVDLRSRSTSTVDGQGAGTVIDKTGAIVVAPDGSTTCANGQGLQFVGSDGSKGQASKNGAFFVDADGKKTSYGSPTAGGRPAGRFTVCNIDKQVSVDLYSDVLFDFDKATLTPAGELVVASAASTIRDDVRGKTVNVVGHTDSTGSADYNASLGLRRANAVATKLRTQVPGIRLEVNTAGETQPAASNATEAGRAKNRRVTISYAR